LKKSSKNETIKLQEHPKALTTKSIKETLLMARVMT